MLVTEFKTPAISINTNDSMSNSYPSYQILKKLIVVVVVVVVLQQVLLVVVLLPNIRYRLDKKNPNDEPYESIVSFSA